MTENDVKGLISALKEAVQSGQNEIGLDAAASLLEGFLVTQIRIAEALEVISRRVS